MNNKKGISLVVLVITIIVLIILGGAVIISLDNTRIIDRATDAVEKLNDNQVQQLAQLGWAEAYLSGATEVEGENGLRAGVERILLKNNLNPEDYGMIISVNGVEKISKGWIRDGFTVVKGTQRLEIGDIIQYDETAGGTVSVDANIQWKVLGADGNGDLLIVSATAPKSVTLGSTTDLTKSQTDWINVESILNGHCEQYGYGKGVIGKARNMKIEDVDAITGYDKNSFGNYGLETTFFYGTGTQLRYKSVKTSGNIWAGEKHDNGFYYYDGEKFVHIEDLTGGTNNTAFTTLTNNFYQYNTKNLEPKIDATNNTKVYKTLFNIGRNYYLANNYISFSGSKVSYGTFAVGGDTFGTGLLTSVGTPASTGLYIRPVVTLSQEITFIGDSETGWKY